jgi:hypothetical protein
MNLMVNQWVHAAPGCAFLFFMASRSGAPDPGRWAEHPNIRV